MRLKAIMVKLIPDEEVILTSKKFAYKEVSFLDEEKYPAKLRMGIESGEQCFITESHFNIDRDFYYIPAFQLVELADEETSKNYRLKYYPKKENTPVELHYDARYDVFYDFPRVQVSIKEKTKEVYWKYCNDLDKAALGSINAGAFYLNIYNASTDEIINFKPYKICVLPSSMSMKQYEDMVNDLLEIKQELLIEKDRGKQSLSISWKNALDEVDSVVKAIAQPLQKINQNPKGTLRKELGEISPTSIKKFDSKVLVDLTANPGKVKYETLLVRESTDIYENQMLLYALRTLKLYLEKGKEHIENKLNNIMRRIEIEKKKIQELYGVEDLDYFYKLLDNRDKAAFYDLMKTYRSDLVGDDEDTIEVEIPIFKQCNEFAFYMYFAEGKLHSKYVGKWIENERRFSLDYNSGMSKGSYTLFKEGIPSNVVIRGRKVSFELVSNNIYQQLFLHREMKSNKVRGLRIRAKVKRSSFDLFDPLKGKQTQKEDGGFYNNTYDYDVNAVEIITINGKKFVNIGDAEQELKKIYIDSGSFLKREQNRDQIMQQIKMIGAKKIRIEEELLKHHSSNAETVDKIANELEMLKNLNFFKNVARRKLGWKLTQVFVHDKNYKKLYTLLNALDKKFQFSDSVNAKDIIHKKADQLYEYWILVKILYVLTQQQQWKLQEGTSVISLISQFLKNKKSSNLEEISFRLTHESVQKGSICMELHYNCKFPNTIKSGFLKPDFAFYITVRDDKGSVKKANWYFLDAKYRNYDSMDPLYWYDDINEVAIKKYTNCFAGGSTPATASFIVHTDEQEKYTYFGGYFDKHLCERLKGYKDDNPKHKFGSFSFLPNHTENFLAFMKLILEYHFMEEGLWRICWDCGSIETKVSEEKTEGGFIKYHIECNECSSFWVRNHCASKSHHELVKHAMNNYHKEDEPGDPWYVKCPECDYDKREY